MKRIISLLMVLVLCCTMLPSGALALDLGGATAVGSEAVIEEPVVEEPVETVELPEVEVSTPETEDVAEDVEEEDWVSEDVVDLGLSFDGAVATIAKSAVLDRIDELYDAFGGKYFNVKRNTACGTKSSGHGCSNCLTTNIVNAAWFVNAFGDVSANQFPQFHTSPGYHMTNSCMSCAAFAQFASWYIFAKSSSDVVSMWEYDSTGTAGKVGTFNFNKSNISNYAQPGDILWTYDTGSSGGHASIFIEANSSGAYVLDCNWGTIGSGYNCKVQKHTINYSQYDKVTISRVPNSKVYTDYLGKCEEYPSYVTVKVTDDTTLKKFPCSAKTDATSTDVYTPKIGDTFTAYALWKNTKGNYWYEVKSPSGTTGYLYAGDTEWVKAKWDDFSVSGMVAPSTIKEGESFYIGGTVKSKYNEITRVKAYVYKGNATSGDYVLYSNSEYLETKYYDLENSKVDAGLLFSSLDPGEYTYVVKAYVDRNNVSHGTDFLRYYNTVTVYTKSFRVETLSSPVVSITNRISDGKPRLTWAAVSGAAKYEVYRATSKNGSYTKTYTTTGTSYTNTAAAAGTTWYYKVKAVSSAGASSAYSNIVSAVCKYARPVVSIQNDETNGWPCLSWAAVEGAMGYEIWRKKEGDSAFTTLTTTTQLTYTDSSTSFGTSYEYKIKALGESSASDSAFSDAVTGSLISLRPELEVVEWTSGRYSIAWSLPTGAEGFEIWRASDESPEFTLLETIGWTNYYDDYSAKPGGHYYYKIRAIGDHPELNREFSNVVEIVYKCAQPVINISCVASTGKPRLTWDAVDGAAKYEIWRATSSGGTYTKMYTTTGTVYNNTSAVAGQTYYYKVRAMSANGEYSEFSTVVNMTCDYAQPVVNISCVATTGKPQLSWSAVSGATSYEVWRASSKNGTYYKQGTTTGTTYTNTSAVAGKTYYYKVRAIGSSSYATSAFSTAKNMTCDCARPVVSISCVATTGKPQLSWSAVSGATSYEVWRATSKDGTYYKQGTTTGTTYTNTSAKANTTYYYKVYAVGSSSYSKSAASSVVNMTCDCARPVVSITTNSSGKPKLTWSAVSGAVRYEVWRAYSADGAYYKMGTTTGTTYTNTSAKTGTTYYFKVRAIGSSSYATSAYSSIVSAKCK